MANNLDFISGIKAEEQTESIKYKSPALLILVIVLAVLIIGGGFYIGTWYKKDLERQAADLNKAITDVEAQIATQQDAVNDAVAFQQQLSNFRQLVEDHIYWVCSAINL